MSIEVLSLLKFSIEFKQSWRSNNNSKLLLMGQNKTPIFKDKLHLSSKKLWSFEYCTVIHKNYILCYTFHVFKCSI